jgi:hypothetical protein
VAVERHPWGKNTVNKFDRIVMTGMALGLIAASQPARAEDAPSTKGACKADVQKFCADVKPGEGRIVQCIKQHESELSDACKQTLAARKEKRKERGEALQAACKEDDQKFCADVKPGDGRKVQCLQSHQAQLSPACQRGLASMRTHGQIQSGVPATQGQAAPPQAPEADQK